MVAFEVFNTSQLGLLVLFRSLKGPKHKKLEWAKIKIVGPETKHCQFLISGAADAS